MFVFPMLSKLCGDVKEANSSPPAPLMTTGETKAKEVKDAPLMETTSSKTVCPTLPVAEFVESEVVDLGIRLIGGTAEMMVAPCGATTEVLKDRVSEIIEELEVELLPEEFRADPDSSSNVPIFKEDHRLKNMAMDIELVREDVRMLKDFQIHAADKLKRSALESSSASVHVLKNRLSEQENVSKNLPHLLSEKVSHLQGQIGSVEVLLRRMQDTLDSEGSYMRGKFFDMTYENKILKEKVAMIEDRLWPSDPSKSYFWSHMNQEHDENIVYNLARMGHLNVTALHDPTVLAMFPRRVDEIGC